MVKNIMTSEEIVRAMVQKAPVISDGIEYKYIAEYVLTIDEAGRKRLSVRLMDKNNRTLVQVKASTLMPKIPLAQ